MPRYKMLIEYDGTDFCGWQAQPEGRTVEGEIERALNQILRQSVDVVGQGRTDSGVHAEGQVAHVDLPETVDIRRLRYALLGVLPGDVAVWDIRQVSDDFHARFHGKARQYRYQILRRPSPLLSRTSEFVPGDMDVEAMKRCAKMIEGRHNFESFTKSTDEQPNPICEVMISKFVYCNPLLVYRVKANRFVRHMVRRLVGTIIQVGQQKLAVDEFRDLLHNPRKDISGHGAAAKGLILEEVEY